MRVFVSMVVGVALVFALVAGLQAQGKEVTLKGTILCAKCELKEAKKCTNAIKVKEGGKDVVYIFEDEGAKAPYHKEICRATKEGSVTGTVGEKDGKKTIKPKSPDAVKFN